MVPFNFTGIHRSSGKVIATDVCALVGQQPADFGKTSRVTAPEQAGREGVYFAGNSYVTLGVGGSESWFNKLRTSFSIKFYMKIMPD